MPWTEGESELTPEEMRELGEAVRDIHLDDCETVCRGLGIPDTDIQKARAECLLVNNDKPFQDLMAASPIYQQQFKAIFG